MSAETPAEMTADERDEFLGNGGTGVISLATDGGPPHSLPVSYGYDRSTTTFYFRLAVGADSEKGDLAGRAVTFVVHGETADGWRSVVAQGRLEATSDDAIATETLRGLDRVHIPLVDIFGRPARTVSFEFYRLEPDGLTTRKEADTDE
ncbi:MAG: pyridoxamine 5'-phosphate oxidase family protein [Haloarculaceae archaeon]